MNIDEHQEKSDFNTKSLTSIPFGGPIGILGIAAASTGGVRFKTQLQLNKPQWRRQKIDITRGRARIRMQTRLYPHFICSILSIFHRFVH